MRNDSYWGGNPDWAKVTFRVIENPAASVAALSTGEVDVADAIPARDVVSVKQRNAKVASVGAARVNFVQFDVAREVLLGVTAKSGEQIPNPFKKPLGACAGCRPGHSDRQDPGGLWYGGSTSVPTGLPGTSAKLQPQEPNYDEAKAASDQGRLP